MVVFNSVEYSVPSHWLSAIVNGDETSFDYYDDKEDYDRYKAFCDGEVKDATVEVVSDEGYFSRSHDASPYGVLPCSVVDCMFHYPTEKVAPYFSEWFNGRDCVKSLPADCIAECSAQGKVDDAVKYWLKELNLEAPAWFLREHLSGYGAWDKAELCNHRANLERLLRLWARDCKEENDSDHRPYLMR